MFDLHKFVMDTLTGMIGKEPEYKVRQYALCWVEKGVLGSDDLEYIEERYAELAAEQEATEVEEGEAT